MASASVTLRLRLPVAASQGGLTLEGARHRTSVRTSSSSCPSRKLACDMMQVALGPQLMRLLSSRASQLSEQVEQFLRDV